MSTPTRSFDRARVRARVLEHVTVNERGCWLYKADRPMTSRRRVHLDGLEQYVYRVMWQIDRGPIPDGLFACHHCDEPRCCNPDHLFIGTCQDNSRDMVAKGRWVRPSTRRGAEAWNATVPDDLIDQVRAEYAAGGVSQKELAARLGVGQTTIGHWTRGEARAVGAVAKPQSVPAHGTRAGYFHHHRKTKDQPCPACYAANAVYMRAYKARRLVRSDVAA